MTHRANQARFTKGGWVFLIMKLIILVAKTRKNKNWTLQIDFPRIQSVSILLLSGLQRYWEKVNDICHEIKIRRHYWKYAYVNDHCSHDTPSANEEAKLVS